MAEFILGFLVAILIIIIFASIFTWVNGVNEDLEYLKNECHRQIEYNKITEKCDRCEKYELCMETPNVDVVERSEYDKFEKEYNHYKRLAEQDVKLRIKINEAIEELIKEIEENRLNVIDYADGEWIIKDFVYGAIDRLKEKITLDK